MATGLLFFDGFESDTELANRWMTAINTAYFGSNYKRSGANGLFLAATSGVGVARWNFPVTADTAIVGAALNLRTSSRPSNAPLLSFTEGLQTAVHCYVALTTTRQLALFRGDGVMLEISDLRVPLQQWFYLEFKLKAHPSTGAAEIRVNGDSWLTITGMDTANGGSSPTVIDGFRISNCAQWVDDVYFVDGSVGTYLGDCRVQRLIPTGMGNYADFTPEPAGAGTNWERVNDTPTWPLANVSYTQTVPNPEMGDYVTGTTGQKDSYSMSDTSLTGSIIAVQTVGWLDKTDAGPRTGRMFLRDGVTDGPGTTISLGYGAPAPYYDIWDTKPSGGAWTTNTVNAVEAGVEVVS